MVGRGVRRALAVRVVMGPPRTVMKPRVDRTHAGSHNLHVRRVSSDTSDIDAIVYVSSKNQPYSQMWRRIA